MLPSVLEKRYLCVNCGYNRLIVQTTENHEAMFKYI